MLVSGNWAAVIATGTTLWWCAAQNDPAARTLAVAVAPAVVRTDCEKGERTGDGETLGGTPSCVAVE